MQRIVGHVRSQLVGYVALFVALGGTAVAATGLAANSVGTKQLKNGAVTGAKVARNTLTGKNIDAATLGTVPDSALLEGTPASKFQARVTGSCSGMSAISAVGTDGSVACEANGDGTITSVSAGTGLTGGGSSGAVGLGVDPAVVQDRVAGTCATGNAISSIAQTGTVACQTANVAQIIGGSTGTISGTSTYFLAPAGLSAPAGSAAPVSMGSSALASTENNLAVHLSTAPGPNAGWEFFFVVDGNQGFSCNITGTSTSCSTPTSTLQIPAAATIVLEAVGGNNPATTDVTFGWTDSTP